MGWAALVFLCSGMRWRGGKKTPNTNLAKMERMMCKKNRLPAAAVALESWEFERKRVSEREIKKERCFCLSFSINFLQLENCTNELAALSLQRQIFICCFAAAAAAAAADSDVQIFMYNFNVDIQMAMSAKQPLTWQYAYVYASNYSSPPTRFSWTYNEMCKVISRHAHTDMKSTRTRTHNNV